MTPSTETDRTWIRASRAARILEVSRKQFTSVAAAGIRSRRLPGTKHREFRREDVERLAAQHT